jgi:PAS domain S-box-containing protein
MFKEKNKQNDRFSVIKMLGFALAYFTAVKVGLCLATVNNAVSPFWPATGVSLGILFFNGRKYWTAIAIGAFAGNLFNGVPYAGIFFITLGNTLHGVVGNEILHAVLEKRKRFGLHSRSIGILAAAFGGAFISATIGTMSLTLVQSAPWEQFQLTWITWFTGDLLGAVIFFPLILAFSHKSIDKMAINKTQPGWWNLFLLTISGLFLLWLIFIHDEGATYLFFLFPYLFWVLSVAGEKGVTVATVIVSLIGVYSVLLGYGVFKHGSMNSNLVNLELFTLSIGICSLMMSDLKKNYSLKQPGYTLMVSWVFAAVFFFGFYFRSIHESDKHFRQIISASEPIMDARLNLYFSALQSGTGLFAASESVEKKEWKSFIETSKCEEKLPGIQGIGVVIKVQRKNLKEFIKSVRRDDALDFQYHLMPGLNAEQIEAADSNESLYIVKYIEPREANFSKIGLDLASEPKRKSGADLARDLGMPTLTEKIVLLDDVKKEPAVLLYYPFYSKGPVPQNISERRQRIMGWIYAPLLIRPFLESIFKAETFKEISLSVEDIQGENLFKNSDYDSLPDTFQEKRTIRMGNRHLVFNFRRSNQFYSSQDMFSSWAGAISIIISLLIGAFIFSLQNVKRNAIHLAEQKTAELKANEELWKYALQGAGDSVWDWDIVTGHFKFTDQIINILGYEKTEYEGGLAEWEKLVHPDDYPALVRAMDEHFKSDKTFTVEHRVKCKDGQYKWLLSRGKIVSRDEENNPERMVGTVSDITSFKNSDLETESQRARLHAIYEGSSDGLFLFSENKFIDCNTRAIKLFGYDHREELLSLHPSEVSPPLQPDGMDSAAKSMQMISKAMETGYNQFEWLHKRKSGEVFPADVTLTAFEYEGKRVLHASVRDISERKLTELSLISQREKLVAAAKMSSLGEMAGGIAHEINNPLAIIIGKISQLKRKLDSQPNEELKKEIESLTVIESTAKRIAAIIKGLSSFSRNAENDKMERVEVLTLIVDTLELSRERFRFNSVDLKLDINFSEKIHVMGKAAQLLQVLVNLLNNAYDAIEFLDEKWVEVIIKHDEKNCTIIVTDSGHGISPVILEKIMTPFFTTKKVGKGTGLGLSISRGIIEDHKGKLYYQARNSHTSFTIELPIA